MGKKRPQLVQDVPSSDDEEIDEDEAFNSEDELQYGSFFASNEQDQQEDVSSDEDEGDDDGGQYMLGLLDRLDDDSKGKSSKKKQQSFGNPTIPESSFAVGSSTKLRMNDLMETITDTDGYGTLARTMTDVVKGSAVSVPNTVANARQERQLHYKHQQKNISGWNAAVKQNRDAETLDFRAKNANKNVTRDMMVDSFVPQTDFEKEIHEAIQQEEETIQQQQDDLGEAGISMEEYKRRHALLAKSRSLLFEYERKRHHMNKIKSKTYRRIRKRQKLREKEGDADYVQQLQEKQELERIQERASLAHKNTSKWAKRILQRKHVDTDTKRALSAQLKRGEDLRQRMIPDDSDEEDPVQAAHAILQEDDDVNNDETRPARGIFALKFMQKGLEKQRERAKEEARELLLELDREEDDEVYGEEEDDSLANKKKKKKSKKASSQAEMKTILKDGSLVVDGLQPGTAAVAVSEAIELEPNDNKDPLQKNGNDSSSSKPSYQDVDRAVANHPSAPNPWMPETAQTKKTKPTKALKRAFVDVDAAVELLDQKDNPTGASMDNRSGTDAAPSSLSEPKKKLTLYTQEELVQRAFAAPDQQEVEDEFAKEKEEAILRETSKPSKREAKNMDTVSGWGSWTGAGAPPPPPLKKKLPPKLQPPRAKPAARRDETLPHVILNHKRLAKMDKYMMNRIPYPFTSREEYERSLQGNLGKEWNVTTAHKSLTRPEILTRSGQIIQPISKTAKVKRAPAKF